MRHIPRFVAVAVLCGALTACGSSSTSSATKAPTTIAGGSGASTGAATTQPAKSGGSADCASVKDAMASMLVNWQIVLGLPNVDVAQWASTPLGTLSKFGDQLKALTVALGSDADAAAALKYMTGANDIVVRGVGGDASAKADLTTYLGTDITKNVEKQIPIGVAYQKAGCK